MGFYLLQLAMARLKKIDAIVKLSGFELFALTLRNMLINHLDEQDIEDYIDNVLIERGEV